MLFGPVFSLEMVTSARRLRYLAARLLYVLVLFAFLVMGYSEFYWTQADARAVSRFVGEFFVLFSVLQLLVVVALTPAMVAGTISQEHERRTLEYLLASQLTNSEIVLGKLTARLLHVGLVLMAGVPILFLVSLMGGIPPRHIVLAGIVTLFTLVAIGSMSMAVSVWSRRTRDGVIKAYIILLALLIVPWIVWGVTQGSGHWALDWLNWGAGVLADFGPFTLIGKMGSAEMMGTQPALGSIVWPVVAGYGGFSLVAILASIASVRRVYLSAAGKGSRRRRWSFRLWRPKLAARPMIWKELFAERAMMRLGWLANGALWLLFGVIIWWTVVAYIDSIKFNAPSSGFGLFAVGMGDFVSCIGVLMCTARAATAITAERERDCWVSLISTPLSAAEIINGKILGNLYAVRSLGWLLAFIWGLAIIREPSFVLVIPFLIASFLVTALFGSCLGMVMSLATNHSLRALAGAISVLFIVSGGYLMCCMSVVGVIVQVFKIQFVDELFSVICAPVIPFLLFIPGPLWEGFHSHTVTHGAGAMLSAYLLGMTGYALAAAGLWAICVYDFDRLNGRPKERKAASATA